MNPAKAQVVNSERPAKNMPSALRIKPDILVQ